MERSPAFSGKLQQFVNHLMEMVDETSLAPLYIAANDSGQISVQKLVCKFCKEISAQTIELQ